VVTSAISSSAPGLRDGRRRRHSRHRTGGKSPSAQLGGRTLRLDKGTGIIVCGRRFSADAILSTDMDLLAGILHQTGLAITKAGMRISRNLSVSHQIPGDTLEAKDENLSSHARSLKEHGDGPLGERGVGLMGPDHQKRLEWRRSSTSGRWDPPPASLKPGRLTARRNEG